MKDKGDRRRSSRIPVPADRDGAVNRSVEQDESPLDGYVMVDLTRDEEHGDDDDWFVGFNQDDTAGRDETTPQVGNARPEVTVTTASHPGSPSHYPDPLQSVATINPLGLHPIIFNTTSSNVPDAETSLQLPQTDLPASIPRLDPFTDWSSIRINLRGNLPSEFYTDTAPFRAWSLRGRARLRFIRDVLGICANDGTNAAMHKIQGFLSRNPSIIRHLAFDTVGHPDWSFEGGGRDNIMYEVRSSPDAAAQEQRRMLLQAMSEVAWTDRRVVAAVRMASGESRADMMCLWSRLKKKRRQGGVMPLGGVLLDGFLDRSEIEVWRRETIKEMRRARPYSLLRYEVAPEDVVEEITLSLGETTLIEVSED